MVLVRGKYPRGVVCASEQSGLSEWPLVGGFGGGMSSCCKGKLQLPKGEPQAHAPWARQAPTRPHRRRGQA